MSFMTEKQIEARLRPVTRELRLPGGNLRRLTMLQMYWESADFVAKRYAKIDTQLEYALGVAQNSRVDLDDALAFIATRLHQWLRECIGEPLDVEPGICPLFYKRNRLPTD